MKEIHLNIYVSSIVGRQVKLYLINTMSKRIIDPYIFHDIQKDNWMIFYVA